MSENPLKTLISKLSPESHKSLEKAAHICMTRGHYNLELEHWMLALLEDETSTFSKMLHHAHCNIDHIIKDINDALEELKTGNDRTPPISNRVVDLIQESWLVASLDFHGEAIHSGILLCTLIQKQTLNQLCLAISKEFAKIQPDAVRKLMAQALSEKKSEGEPEATQDKPAGKSSKTPALDQYTNNLNEQAKHGKIDAAIGREDEIRQVIDILSRRRQNNAILTGEPGVGKTAIVEGLALKIVHGDVPELLKNVIIHTLDMGLLQAGASVKGEFENRLKNLIKEVKSSPHPIILFIDEAHTMIGAGGGAGQNDAANLLKPALARGELRSIAATTWAEYKLYFEKDAALTRRFQVVKVEEPNLENAARMLRSLVPGLEKHHGVKVLDEAVQQATTLSNRYIMGRQLPDKSISVLDTACSRVSSKLTTTPAEVEQLDKLLVQLKTELERLEAEQKRGITHEARIKELHGIIAEKQERMTVLNTQWEQEKPLVTEILALSIEIADAKAKEEKTVRQKLDVAMAKLAKIQGDHPLIQPYVDGNAVADVIGDWTGIPVGKMMKNELAQLSKLDKTLKRRVVGQDYGLEQIADTIKISSAKLSDPNKPIGVFLLVGPSGVGKTETALTLAEEIFGSEDKITVINMSEFKEEHKISTLAGSPPGYVGYGEGGVLTEAVRRKPYSLILLDEMEKAHPGLQDVFYQVFDKGILKDGQGRDINFKNTLIVMTANTCSDLITQLCADPELMPEPAALLDAIQDELAKTFKPAFLGRVRVIPYLPLSETVLRQVIQLKLKRIQNRVKAQHKVELTYDEAVESEILTMCQQQSIGARQIDNILSNKVLPELSRVFLDGLADQAFVTGIHLSVNKGAFTCEVQNAKVASKQKMQKIEPKQKESAKAKAKAKKK